MKIEQLEKVRFFGKCIGLELKVPDEKENGVLTAVNKSGIVWREDDCDYDIDDCQIIARRIKSLTSGEKVMLNNMVGAYDDVDEEVYNNLENTISCLSSIGVFPDKYFDELKWCVEA